MQSGENADQEGRALARLFMETWAVVEMHFLSRPHLMTEAREELARCLRRLRAGGLAEPHVLKDLACRAIQLRYGPAPARRGASPRRRLSAAPAAALPHGASASLLVSAR
jgi:hypothetical protein